VIDAIEHPALLEIDRSLAVISCSPAVCTMFACTESDLVGCDIDALVPGSGFSMRIRANELPDEIVSLHIAGRPRLARVTVTPREGSYVCRLDAVADKNLLHRMVETAERWRALVRDTEDGIGVLGIDGRIVEHNAAFVSLLGLPLRSGIAPQGNAHVGITLRKLLRDDVQGFIAYLERPEGEYIGQRRSGPRTVEVKARALLLADGTTAGTLIHVRDISEELQLRDDLERARVFQSMILSAPPDISPYDLEIAYRPLDKVGGDLYDVSILPASSVRVFIADATGHGVAAALVTMLVRSVYESVKYTLGGPSAVLEALNDRVSTAYRGSDVIFTGIVLDLALETGFLEYAVAGHPPPLLVDSAGVHELNTGGTVLGARGYRTYPSWSQKVAKDASIYLVTDGIAEARRAKDYFGDDRLKAAVLAADTQASATASVLAELDRWLGTSRQDDDITLIALRPQHKRPR
jgi:PAS domain S-box-containing protein